MSRPKSAAVTSDLLHITGSHGYRYRYRRYFGSEISISYRHRQRRYWPTSNV